MRWSLWVPLFRDDFSHGESVKSLRSLLRKIRVFGVRLDFFPATNQTSVENWLGFLLSLRCINGVAFEDGVGPPTELDQVMFRKISALK